MDIVNLFLLPYAGGNKYCYRNFYSLSKSFVKMETLEYPGRGGRIKEDLLRDINFLVDDLFSKIKSKVLKGNYALYGHSMGGLVASVLTRKIISEGLPCPNHVFITGTIGPSSRLPNIKKKYLLNKNEFFNEILSLNEGTQEFFENEELVDYFEPILRADFEICETFDYVELDPLPIKFTVITGSKEKMHPADIFTWQKESQYEVDFKELPGNHFFIFEQAVHLMDIILKKIYDSQLNK